MRDSPHDPARSPTGLSEVTSILPGALTTSEAAELLRATADAMLDPQMLLEAVRDPEGRLVDLVVRSVNRAASIYAGGSEDNYLNRSVAVTLPNLKVSGMMEHIVQCFEDGKPVIMDDVPYFSDVLLETRHFDCRATQAGVDLIAFTWRDVTERFQYIEQIAASERKYRRSIDNAAVGMCLITPEGRFEDVNDALCRFLGYDAETLKQKNWQELTAPGYADEDIQNVTAVLEGRVDSYRRVKQYVHAEGHLVWGDLSVGCMRDADGQVQYLISEITDITAQVEATERNRILADELRRQKDRLEVSERTYRLLAENAGDLVCHTREDDKGRHIIVWISPNVEAVLGAPPKHWVGRALLEFVSPDEARVHAARWKKVRDGGPVGQRVRMSSIDGVVHWFHARIKPYYDAEGHRDGAVIAAHLVDDEILAELAVERARQQQARSDERYRRSMETAVIGIGLLTPAGKFTEVNPALCQLMGYDAATLTQKTWQELTPPEYLGVGQEERDALFAGRLDAYRIVKQYIHADGHRIWADVSVSSVRDDNGEVETLAFQIADITVAVEANQRNDILTQRLAKESERLATELGSAASYMSSIMPKGLNGKVSVSSRYLPSSELGGDSFDYIWIDDDHLLVYLIDVSGHGLEPALLSVSVHNMLRSRSIAGETLLAPEAVLTELNQRFQMEQHDDHYFTMWYGVYQASSGTLRYSSAGCPPALAFASTAGSAVCATELSTTSPPIGMFEDSVFTMGTYSVSPGSRLLVFSDGATDVALADGRQLTWDDFKNLATRVATSPNWSLDELIGELNALTPSGAFQDDCSLIQLKFPQSAEQRFAEAVAGDTGHSGRRIQISSQHDPLGALQADLDELWSMHPQVPDGVRMQVTIAAAEVGANILEHTGRGQLLRVWMNAAVIDDRVHVAFTDNGAPADIDLASAAMPDATAEHGRGLAMAQALLAQLTYRYDESGNHWTLISQRFA